MKLVEALAFSGNLFFFYSLQWIISQKGCVKIKYIFISGVKKTKEHC